MVTADETLLRKGRSSSLSGCPMNLNQTSPAWPRSWPTSLEAWSSFSQGLLSELSLEESSGGESI